MFDDHNTKFRNQVGILFDAFLYEPANFCLSLINNFIGPNLYIQSTPPTKLHQYCEPYARNNPSINIVSDLDNDPILSCVGCGYETHQFLSIIQYSTCIHCHACICKHCTFCAEVIQGVSSTNDSYCIDCFLSENSISPTKLVCTLSRKNG